MVKEYLADDIRDLHADHENTILNHFNWGAAFFTFIWGAFNGAFHKTFWFVLLVSCISVFNVFIGSVLMIVLAIIFGIKGNQWAWKSKEWDDIETFQTIQKNWALAFVIVYAVLILICALVGFVLFPIFADSFTKTASAQARLISNGYVQHIVKAGEINDSSTGKDVASYISTVVSASGADVAQYNLNTIVVTSDDSSGNKRSVIYSFNKNGKCNLEQKNCSIDQFEPYGDTLKPVSRTYFDNTGKIKTVRVR